MICKGAPIKKGLVMVVIIKRTSHGARWDEESDEELRRRFTEGQLLPDVARAMKRSQEAVRTRANVLRVPVRSTTRRRVSDQAEA